MSQSKVSDLLEKINWVLNNPDFPNISKIEMDILMQYTREFYNELDNLRAQIVVPVKETSDIIKSTHTFWPEATNRKKQFQANDSLLLEEKQAKVKEVKPIEEKPKKATVQEPVVKETRTGTINENIKFPSSLNEKLKSSGNEVHKRLSSKPLKDMIDLNKRFVILNELFKGNAEAFSSAVNHIDSLNDYNEAQAFVQTQLVSNYFWDESSQSVRMFMKLVKQRFGVE
jgi:hypothetical protein